MAKIPTREEMETFLKRQIAEARRLRDQARCDRLLEQFFNLDDTMAFAAQVLANAPLPGSLGVEDLLG